MEAVALLDGKIADSVTTYPRDTQPADSTWEEGRADGAQDAQAGLPADVTRHNYRGFAWESYEGGYYAGHDNSVTAAKTADFGQSTDKPADKPTDGPVDHIDAARQVLQTGQHQTVDGATLDTQSAHAITTLHDALSPENQQKYQAMPLTQKADLAWKLLGGGQQATAAALDGEPDPHGDLLCIGCGNHYDSAVLDGRVCPNCSDALIPDASLLGSGDDEPFDRWGSRTADYVPDCKLCDGTGKAWYDSSGATTCTNCGGTGKQTKCPDCGGRGEYDVGRNEVFCDNCHGSGFVGKTAASKTADFASTLDSLTRFDGAQVRLTFTGDGGVDSCSGTLSVRDGNAVVTGSGGQVHSIPAHNVLGVQPTGYSTEAIPLGNRQPSIFDMASEWLMSGAPMGASGARKTANPYAPGANPYLTEGPGTPNSDFKAPKDDPDGAVQLDEETSEPATTRPRVMPEGDPTSLLPDPNREAYPLDEAGSGAIVDTEPAARAASRVAQAEAAILTPTLAMRIEAKVRQIVADIADNEPEVTTVDAVQRAVAVIGHYPGLVRVAHPAKGEAVPDMQQALDDYLHHFLEQHGIAHA